MGGQSKRVTLHQKYKIQKRCKEHKRKLKKAAKKNGLNGTAQWRSKQVEAMIPNDWPFKDQMLAEVARQREFEKATAEKNKAARKAAAEKKKRDAAAGKVAQPAQSALPTGMGAPAPVSFSTKNAILLDAFTRRVWREIKQVVEESDIILEVLDARDPLGSRCFEMEEWVSGKAVELAEKKIAAAAPKGNGAKSAAYKAAVTAAGPVTAKPIILVLNKCDLVPTEVVDAWLQFFAKHDHFPALAFHTNRELDKAEKKGQVVSPKELCAGAESLLGLIANFQASADVNADAASQQRKPLKVGIIGYQNVGKSSVLNTLARTHASGVGPIGGFTKELHRYKLGKGLYAIDTPGVPTKEEAPGPHTHLPISNNRVTDDVGDFIAHFDLENLCAVLGMQVPDLEDEGKDPFKTFLDGLASRTGRMMQGGLYNHVAGARKLFKDWNEGKLLYYTPPPQLDNEEAADEASESGPIQKFFVAANKKTVAGLKKTAMPASKFLVVNGSLFDHGDDEDDEDEEGEDGEEDGTVDAEGDEMMAEDGEDDDEEDEDGDDGAENDDEEVEMVEMSGDEEDDEEEEEEEQAPPPPPPSKKNAKGKQAAAPVAPAPVSNKKSAAASPAKPAKAAAKPAASTPAPRSSRKRSARDEEEEDDEQDATPVRPASKKQAAAPKANASKPTPKAAPAPQPQSASKKGKGKK